MMQVIIAETIAGAASAISRILRSGGGGGFPCYKSSSSVRRLHHRRVAAGVVAKPYSMRCSSSSASSTSSSSSECKSDSLDDSTPSTCTTTTASHFGQQQQQQQRQQRQQRQQPPPPPPPTCDYLAHDYKHVLHPYTSMTTPLPTFPVRSAKGVYIELEENNNGQHRRLIDGMSSWWAAIHGYQHAVLDAAVRNQLEKMSHVMFGGLTHRPATELCHLIVQLLAEATVDGTRNDDNDDDGQRTLNKVFLCDSGSVSVEVAMKMAIQYWYTITKDSSKINSSSSSSSSSSNKKTKFLSLRHGYHGDTFGAMSVCDPVNGMHSMFTGGMLAQQHFVESPTGPTVDEAMQCAQDVERVLSQSHHEIAALICEPIVQGAGGMRFHHPVLLQRLRRLCDEYNVLLIFDEIATGFGRTGTLFACQQNANTFTPWYSSSTSLTPCASNNQHGIEQDMTPSSSSSSTFLEQTPASATTVVLPDIICLGKALTGGYMTMGATVASDRIAEGISSSGGVFMHGPTFMGNPLACATALASLNLLVHDSPWQDRVQNVRAALIQALAPAAQLPTVQQVRVLGAIGVVQLVEPVKDMAAMQQALVYEHGVWLRPFGKLLYTMPPFNCPELTMDHVHAIGRAICSVAASQ
jgi:adenosylmethionine---8-amino-7-oxononanoate aminotransferase